MIRNLAIVGATGAVGREVCTLIEQRNVATNAVTLLASTRSAGAAIVVSGRSHAVTALTAHSFKGVDFVVFCAGKSQSRAFAPAAVRSGAVVVDNSSAFRMDPDVPLIIPEINGNAVRRHRGIIANPNCSTIMMNMAVWPLHRINPVERIVVSTYQAASGAGTAAMEELTSQTADVLAGKEPVPGVFPYACAFNLFSHDTPIGDDGYNTEERKMIDETRKIFAKPDLAISATCVRVPVSRAHSESINLTFRRPITPEEVRDTLEGAPGIRIVDDAAHNHFPMPIEAAGQDDVLVGRIRRDAGQPGGQGIEMFVSGDQLRKGAALNALQIIELLAG